MPDPTASYQIRSNGLWKPVLRISGPEGGLGVLNVERNRWGMVVSASYLPTQGERIDFKGTLQAMRDIC
jgi:hypothetical protein